jgi:hypothetical protein
MRRRQEWDRINEDAGGRMTTRLRYLELEKKAVA